jgi:release factor glutamine methyltransferase
MILKEVLDKTITFFKQKNFETPRLDAELLIASGLGLERIQLYLKYDQPLKDPELEKLRELVKRRTLGEPIAYILGHKEFYKSNFKVNSSVLIPRPETESLVEITNDLVEKKIKENTTSEIENKISILDLGSGSGCIAVSIAKENEDVEVYAVEKSPEAFLVLQENVTLNECKNIKTINQDAENEKEVIAESVSKFDFIVSNPPYIDIEDVEVDAAVKKFEPHEALFAAEKGFYFIDSWIQKYSPYLKPGGIFIFEMGYKQGDILLKKYLDKNLFSEIKVLKDLSGKDRFFFLKK